jgi:SAM-dependent methyltransferase
MLDFSSRSNRKELLDGVGVPFEDLALNMKELNTINTYLGGHAITLHGFKKLLGTKKRVSVLEIGCGGGDNLKAVENYCTQNKIEIQLMGIDINFDIITYAIHQNKKLEAICSDYKQVQFKTKPDIIFSSLFCHHFSNDELIEQLHWMKENSTLGFFINDLHRHWLAYYSIKLITLLFSKSYLVKNDAPLSVARGFRKVDWMQLLKKAACQRITIQWKWAFRYLISYKHDAA